MAGLLAVPVPLLVVALVALACAGTSPTVSAHDALRPATSRPTVRKLDPDLRAAIAAAARDARRDGVTLLVTSGWRSRAHQGRLFREAVSRYGSEEAALRYVATPDDSAHVTCDAVDIGPRRPTSGSAGTGRRTGSARSSRTRPGTSSWPRRRAARARRCIPTAATGASSTVESCA